MRVIPTYNFSSGVVGFRYANPTYGPEQRQCHTDHLNTVTFSTLY